MRGIEGTLFSPGSKGTIQSELEDELQPMRGGLLRRGGGGGGRGQQIEVYGKNWRNLFGLVLNYIQFNIMQHIKI